jgi:hypothetical protein
MNRTALVILASGLLVGAVLIPTTGIGGETRNDAERLQALIVQLGSERFDDRQEASRLLELAGEPALRLLRAALTSSDLEVRRRAEDLIPRIEMKLETAHAIAPLAVHFKCQDKSVSDAIAEFAKLTGHPIQMIGDLSKLADRRITLDTGETTFWDAFGQLCAKAGIRESETQPEQPVNPNQAYFVGRGGIRMGRRFIVNSYYPPQRLWVDTTLMVEDGPTPNYASVANGAMRVRALPAKGNVFTDLPDGTKQVALQIEVKPEVRLEITQFIALRIDRVLDNVGHKVHHTGDFVETGSNQNIYNEALIWQLQDGLYEQPTATNIRQIPISVIVGNKTIPSLRELSGTVCARVRTPPEPFVTINEPSKAVGKTIKGSDGSEVKVTECKRSDDGLLQVKIELKTPLTSEMNDQMVNAGLMQLRGAQADQFSVALNKDDPNSVPFKVRNTNGEAMDLVNGNLHILANNESSRVYTLVYKPNPNDAEPAKIEYIGRREILIEVPYTLKDISLIPALIPLSHGPVARPEVIRRA